MRNKIPILKARKHSLAYCMEAKTPCVEPDRKYRGIMELTIARTRTNSGRVEKLVLNLKQIANNWSVEGQFSALSEDDGRKTEYI